MLLRVSRRSRHSHEDCRITFYSVPPMRLQRRPSAAPRCFPRSFVGGATVPWTPPRPFIRRVNRRVTASALRAAGGDPEPAGGPGEDQQRDDSGHAPRTTRACPSSSSSAPPIAPPVAASSPSIVRLRRVHLGRAAERRARGYAAARRRRATGGLRYRPLQAGGCGGSSRNEGPPPPFTRKRARSFARDDPGSGH